MKGVLKWAVLLALMLTIRNTGAFAQTTTTSGTISPNTEIDTKEFPLWAKDLRRGEIVAFGTFPFTMFAATFALDTWRWANNNMDQKYAPWPFKSAGAVNMTTEEHERTMLIAAAASVTLALTDYVIVRVKRYKQAQKASKLPAGSPIIIERPGAKAGAEEGTEASPVAAETPPSNQGPDSTEAAGPVPPSP
ncbi:hypothetical protein AGMMS49546_16080 [Spirochaetia bacterium]|nr:hypothetical protein AGMMS49546_16080 [Spirochaetia bacterium]